MRKNKTGLWETERVRKNKMKLCVSAWQTDGQEEGGWLGSIVVSCAERVVNLLISYYQNSLYVCRTQTHLFNAPTFAIPPASCPLRLVSPFRQEVKTFMTFTLHATVGKKLLVVESVEEVALLPTGSQGSCVPSAPFLCKENMHKEGDRKRRKEWRMDEWSSSIVLQLKFSICTFLLSLTLLTYSTDLSTYRVVISFPMLPDLKNKKKNPNVLSQHRRFISFL